MSSPPLSPRPVFDPHVAAPHVAAPHAAAPHVAAPHAAAPTPAGKGAGWRAAPAALLAYYRDPLSWLALGATAVMLCYVGGLIMFWFHAVQLEEGGPAISWYSHWLLDSTFGFIALTPPLMLIMPCAVSVGSAIAGPARPRVLFWAYVVVAGGIFSVVTAPGPIAHNLVVGRGTWIADRVTEWIGDPSAQLAPAQEYPVSAALTQQLGAAVVVYLLLTLATVVLVRGLLTVVRQRRVARLAPAGRAAPGGRTVDGPGMRVR